LDKISETPVFLGLLTESYFNVIVNASYNSGCFHILILSRQKAVFSCVFKTFPQGKRQLGQDPAEKILLA